MSYVDPSSTSWTNSPHSSSSIQPPSPSPAKRQHLIPSSSFSSNNLAGVSSPSQMKSWNGSSKKKKRVSDRILPSKVRDLIPESQAYIDLLTFERKLDSTIMRKRLDIQEALKRPLKSKRKLRLFISSSVLPKRSEDEGGPESAVIPWELRIEGRLLSPPDESSKKKFSSFFKSVLIELDKNCIEGGGDKTTTHNHIIEWRRSPMTQEADGFQIRRKSNAANSCGGVPATFIFMLDYQPMQYKVDPRLARLLGVHTQTRPVIVSALWQYIKTRNLQDTHEREYIVCDAYLKQIFQTERIKFAELPTRLNPLLYPPDPIVINHVIQIDDSPTVMNKTQQYLQESTKRTNTTAIYDIDVEFDESLKTQMNSFLLSTSSQQEIQSLNNKIVESVNSILSIKNKRDFYLSFASNPHQFIHKWIMAQCKDLRGGDDKEMERKTDFYYQAWVQEAVLRYFYGKIQEQNVEFKPAFNFYTF